MLLQLNSMEGALLMLVSAVLHIGRASSLRRFSLAVGNQLPADIKVDVINFGSQTASQKTCQVKDAQVATSMPMACFMLCTVLN